MDIISLGHSSFKIRGKSVTLVTDPFDSSFTGLKFPKHTACDIVTVSHSHKDHNNVSQLEGDPFVVQGAGEYDIKGIGIIGITTEHGNDAGKNTVYRIEMDDVTIVHLGDIGRLLTAAELDILDGVDILFVPVGGTYTTDAVQAKKIIAEIEPSIVIPMHYGRPGLSIKDLAPVSVFLKEMEKEQVVAQPKLTISKSKLPEEKQLVVLE
ncbi:MAG: MBL fold metallo-hydrolase [Candidatus Gottesmanbacteria bacterium]